MTAIADTELGNASQVASAQALVVLDHPTTSRRARLVSLALYLTVRPGVWAASFIAKLPWPNIVPAVCAVFIECFGRAVVRPASGFAFVPVALPRCRGRWYSPSAGKPDQAILYLHGGAFVACGVHTHKRIATTMGRNAGAGVLLVDYRQMPYYTIDESVRDCVDGYRWLLAQGWAPERIAFAGDSAGGFLVFATALRARELGLPLPAGLAAIAPLADWDLTTKSNHPNSRVDSLFAARSWQLLRTVLDRTHRRASKKRPVHPMPDLFGAQLEGLPPSMIHVSSSESLLVDAQKLASALAAAGVPTTLKTWAGQAHVFQGVAPAAPEARASLNELGAFIRSATAA